MPPAPCETIGVEFNKGIHSAVTYLEQTWAPCSSTMRLFSIRRRCAPPIATLGWSHKQPRSSCMRDGRDCFLVEVQINSISKSFILSHALKLLAVIVFSSLFQFFCAFLSTTLHIFAFNSEQIEFSAKTKVLGVLCTKKYFFILYSGQSRAWLFFPHYWLKLTCVIILYNQIHEVWKNLYCLKTVMSLNSYIRKLIHCDSTNSFFPTSWWLLFPGILSKLSSVIIMIIEAII